MKSLANTLHNGPELRVRPACVDDARRIFRLLSTVEQLERNSCYAYLLLCSHFADTCLVAEREDELVGFVAAYRPPCHFEEVFVWQVGVARSARGIGLGRRLLEALIALPACHDARFLTATVAPSNAASFALFRSFARTQAAACEEKTGFVSALFAEPHPHENLLRIGPLKGRT